MGIVFTYNIGPLNHNVSVPPSKRFKYKGIYGKTYEPLSKEVKRTFASIPVKWRRVYNESKQKGSKASTPSVTAWGNSGASTVRITAGSNNSLGTGRVHQI